jgi:chitin synthase
MYLAEDRILCYELVAKKNCCYTLRYVKEATARTDVPTDLTDLIKQRRRWLNGSLFALMYALLGWGRLLSQSSHSFPRKLMLTLQFFYYIVMVVMQWLSVANLYLVFWVLINQYDSSIAWYETFKLLFGSFLVLQGILGLGNKPKRVSLFYVLSAIVYGCFNLLILGVLFYQIVYQNGIASNPLVLWSLVLSFGTIFFISFIYGAIFEVLGSFFQYLFLSPMYLIIFPIYSIWYVITNLIEMF